MSQWAIRKINDLLLGTGSPLPSAARAEEPESPSHCRRQALPMHQPLPEVEDVLMQLRFIVMETRSLFLSKPSLMAWIKTSFPLGSAQQGELHCSYPRHPLPYPGASAPGAACVLMATACTAWRCPKPVPKYAHHTPSASRCAPHHKHIPASNSHKASPCLSPPAGPKQPEDRH